MMDSLPSDRPSPPAVAERRETAGQIVGILAALPPKQQEVVRLKFQTGLSYREISDITGLSVSNVGVLIHLAIRSIREKVCAPRAA